LKKLPSENHENTKSRKHEIGGLGFEGLRFVISFFRDFVIDSKNRR